jgi:hypothetical protein
MQWLDPYTRRTLAKRFCPSCWYDVADLVSRGTEKCPECGRLIAATELVAQRSEPPIKLWAMPLALAPSVCGIALFIVNTRVTIIMNPSAWLCVTLCLAWSFLLLVFHFRHLGWRAVLAACFPAVLLAFVNVVVFMVARVALA